MATVPHFEQLTEREGCIKVRLYFHTWEPNHVRSQVLISEMNMEAPFVEDVSVLLPAEEVYNRSSSFEDIFRSLQSAGVLAPQDKLKSFELRDEDIRTLAYFETEKEEHNA